ncbi:MAG: hypothetical protein WCG87_03255 [Bacteroidota bacterium]
MNKKYSFLNIIGIVLIIIGIASGKSDNQYWYLPLAIGSLLCIIYIVLYMKWYFENKK